MIKFLKIKRVFDFYKKDYEKKVKKKTINCRKSN